jgi:hypothetical protein
MKRIGYSLVCLTSLAFVALTAAVAAATPGVNSAIINERIFNDCSGSTLSTLNSYPASIFISDDAEDGCGGFANLHNWRFSEDGSNPAIFSNGDLFRFSADLVIDGPGQCEAGLQISPWWSPNVEGRLNVRTTDGEIAMFGGVLPFFSFSNLGVFYQKGHLIHIEFNYIPNSNTELDPATLECKIIYDGNSYTSGALPFSNYNPNEDPIYHSYGIMEMAQAGGHIQCLWQAGAVPDQEIHATWSNIEFSPDAKPTAATNSSWGRVKTMYR